LIVECRTYDAFFTKISANGATNLFSTYLGGRGADVGLRIAVKGQDAYLTGYSYSSNFPITTNVARTHDWNASASDVFVTKFSPKISVTNQIVFDATNQIFITNQIYFTNRSYFKNYSVKFGSKGSDQAFGIAVNDLGQACIAGFAASTNFFGTNSFVDFRSKKGLTGQDAFVVLLETNASTFVSAALFGGTGSDAAHGVALESGGNAAYVVGSTTSVNFPTVHSIKPRPHGTVPLSDAFIVRMTLP